MTKTELETLVEVVTTAVDERGLEIVEFAEVVEVLEVVQLLEVIRVLEVIGVLEVVGATRLDVVAAKVLGGSANGRLAKAEIEKLSRAIQDLRDDEAVDEIDNEELDETDRIAELANEEADTLDELDEVDEFEIEDELLHPL